MVLLRLRFYLEPVHGSDFKAQSKSSSQHVPRHYSLFNGSTPSQMTMLVGHFSHPTILISAEGNATSPGSHMSRCNAMPNHLLSFHIHLHQSQAALVGINQGGAPRSVSRETPAPMILVGSGFLSSKIVVGSANKRLR